MDPLSVSASITAIVTICGSGVKAFHRLCSTYMTASLIIASICSETAVISASLTQIQSLINRQPEAFSSQLVSRPELFATFDTALTGCMLIATCLEGEARRLSYGAGDSKGVAWQAKARFILNQNTLKELLQTIRGQQVALTLLIQALQMESIADVRDLLQHNSEALEQIAHRTRSLRSSNRRISQLIPESVLTASQTQRRTSEDWVASTIGSTEFAFDDIIVNTTVYRKNMAAAQQRASRSATKPKSQEGRPKDKKGKSKKQPKKEPPLDPKRFAGIKCDACEELLDHRLQGPRTERILKTECGHLHHEVCLLLQLTLTGPSHMCCPSCARPSKVKLS